MSPVLAIAGGLLAALALWFAVRRRVDVPCTLDLEATQEHFHAHVELQGVAPNEGDEVLVHDAPTRLAPGEKRRMNSRATVHQASAARRAWTRLVGTSEITSLYEVGFEG
jgi:LPXTG-motif cell wall-anchored protein